MNDNEASKPCRYTLVAHMKENMDGCRHLYRNGWRVTVKY